ncbi:MAG: succinate--CoA ligase [Alphaproteobacteria bacterium]|nr:succinate--CoA ligase [Alphaproteobacteria bacterium]|tara:strand:+ start:4732 stop:5856 length:1125 start_codon:yes stop_codon:yes gene_type:complete
MDFEEHAAKPLLAAAGIAIPRGQTATTPEQAAKAAGSLGPVVVKAQVPTGKRGKAGGIKPAVDSAEAQEAAHDILGMTIGEHTVERVLVEEQADISRELYAAVLNDTASKAPLVLFSTLGGMDIEEAAAHDADAVRRLIVDIRQGFDSAGATAVLEGLDLGDVQDAVADVLVRLYDVWRSRDAELVEINPLAITADGGVVALDCKFTLDDLSKARQEDITGAGVPDKLTDLEARGRELGLTYIELDGEIGILANGAGLTMTTMDAVRHYGGNPANFLEIGGQSYTLATPALDLVLSNPKVKTLVVNFCGAFARTDVMTEGVVSAWEELKPDIPVFFSIHGTGSKEAVPIVRERLKMEPFPTMDEAVQAAIEAAK